MWHPLTQKNLSTWKSFECTTFSFFFLFFTDPSSLQSFLFMSLPYQASLKIPFSSSLSPYNNLVCVTSFNSLKKSVHLKIIWVHHFLFFLTDPSLQFFLFVSLPYQASLKTPFSSSLSLLFSFFFFLFLFFVLLLFILI